MTPEELIKYEMTSWAEFCSIDWIQEILARYYASKVNRKWYRYQKRLTREKYLKEKGFIS